MYEEFVVAIPFLLSCLYMVACIVALIYIISMLHELYKWIIKKLQKEISYDDAIYTIRKKDFDSMRNFNRCIEAGYYDDRDKKDYEELLVKYNLKNLT